MADDVDFLKRQYYVSALGLTETQAAKMTINDLEYQFFSSSPVASLQGTGSPQGTVTAPVGTYYTDTAVTNGALQWAKKTGSGNTGWTVVVGDTGWRNVTSLLNNGWTGSAYLRRTDAFVDMRLDALNASAATTGVPITPPVGFQLGNLYSARSLLHTSATVIRRASIAGTDLNIVGYVAGDVLYGSVVGITGDAWPTTLPGIPA